MLTTEALTEHNAKWAVPVAHIKCPSSASSVSSDGEKELLAGKSLHPSTLWRVQNPGHWAEVRLVQIEQGLHVFREAGFLYRDDIARCVNWACSMLSVVLSDVSACEERAMASSSYWTIHLCQIGFSYLDSGEGYKICSHSMAEINEKVECWTMSNMHKLLSGEKSKAFKDLSRGGEYLTQVSSQAARKNRFGRWATRGNARTKNLDIRPLGDEEAQQAKTATFFMLWDAAGLPAVDTRIRERRPPNTHLFAKSQSARSRKADQVLGSRDALLATQSIGRILHAEKRASMGPVKGSGIQAALFAAPKRPVSVVRVADLSDDEVDDDGVPIPRASHPSHPTHPSEDEPTGRFCPAELPSDDEEDVAEKKESVLVSLLQDASAVSAVSAVRTEEFESSDDDSGNNDSDNNEDDPSESDNESASEEPQSGPREEGASYEVMASESKKMLLDSISDRERERVEQALSDKQKQLRGETLTKCQLKNIDWLSRISMNSLMNGEFKIIRRARQPTVEQMMKRRLKQAAIERRKKALQELRDARQNLQIELRKQLDERTRERFENRLKLLQAKEVRKQQRQERRIQVANAKLNARVQSQRETERKRRLFYEERASKSIEYAKKRKVDAVALVGETKLKILLHPKKRKEPPPPPENIVAGSYAELFKVQRRQASRATNAVAVATAPLQGKPGAIRVVMKPRAGKRGGTRAASSAAAQSQI